MAGEGGPVTAGDEVKDEAMYLPKNRIKAQVVHARSGLFILGFKKSGKNYFGHMFTEENGSLHKMKGFAEGSIADISANGTHRFARNTSGGVIFLTILVPNGSSSSRHQLLRRPSMISASSRWIFR
eukprot:scaffold193_cov139-Amphora_coffeaeformis.AAC.5